MKQIIAFLLLSTLGTRALAQKTAADTARILPEVTITAFEQQRSPINSATAFRVLDYSSADRSTRSSLLQGFNSIAGVRMEERSPGSYRISIRGSSLRAPFGVRNVKVYWNAIPVTDPGGNTYFNQYALNNFSSLEILKGPAGSMYGSGTGGLILLHSFTKHWKPGADLELIGGSYSLQNLLASAEFGAADRRNRISYAHNENKGYRDQSAMRRDNASWSSQMQLSNRQQLEAHVLFTDMEYQTPGGLTFSEYQSNPRQARPAAGAFPSAVAASAAIYQKNFVAGISHHFQLNTAWQNTSSLYGAFSQIRNAAIRNYERRNEPHFGGRTSWIYERTSKTHRLQLVAGAEWQQGFFNTQVSNNRNGNPDTLQTNDDITYTNYNLFVQADLEFYSGWVFTAGGSLNKSTVQFKRLNVYPVVDQQKVYKNELAPRISVVRRVHAAFSLYASVSRGFSPPTVSELLPSTGVISTNLEAESGINYEAGTRHNFFNNQLQIELSVFYFKLKNALVVRKDNSNADYYVNAGDARQKGLELSVDYYKALSGPVLKGLVLRSASSVFDFAYGDFKKDQNDYSGKKLPGVPPLAASVQADLLLAHGIYFNSTYYHSTRLYLNDGNTVETPAYDLLGLRLGARFAAGNHIRLNLYGGTENLLNETYSLGNDINAAAGRYYNAAAPRNYYAGLALRWE